MVEETPQNRLALSRRGALQAFGLLGAAGLGVGSTGTASAASAEWEEEYYNWGHYQLGTSDNRYRCFEQVPKLVYHGYHDEDDYIAHTFTFSVVGHTFIAYEGHNGRMIPDRPDEYVQTGNRFTVENPDGSEEMSLDRTYPGHVGEETDTTWTEVIEEDDESWDKYENEVESEVGESKNNNVAADLIAIASSAILSGLTASTGVGAAAALAYWMFDSSGAKCGEEKLRDPDGYYWNFCDGGVPINLHHVELEIHVPWDGDAHSGTINQEIDFYESKEVRLDSDYYDCDNAFYWDIDLPGERSNATLLEKGTYLATD
jgi:hypothetical protein